MTRDLHPRIAQVAAGPKGCADDGPWDAIATGFAVSSSRVLTAAHAVRSGGRHRVRFIEKDRDTWLEAELLWNGLDPERPEKERCDVAVLGVKPAEVEAVLGGPLRPVLSLRLPRTDEHWWSRGLLRAAETVVAGERRSELEDFKGTLHTPAHDNLMTLVVDAPPAVAEEWQGGSGSPVFIQDALVGVVCSWPSQWDGKTLKAVWLGGLEGAAGFLEALGIEWNRPELDDLRKRVARALHGKGLKGLCDVIAERLDVSTCTPQDIAVRLCAMDPKRLVALANSVYDYFMGEGDEASGGQDITSAGALCKAVDLALTAALDGGAIATLRTQSGAPLGLLALPCCSMSVAELYMARLDGRLPDHSLEPKDDRERPGKLGIPVKVNAAGFHVATFDELLEHLANACHIGASLRSGTSPDDLARRINGVLEDFADPELYQPPKRWYLLCPDESIRDDALKLQGRIQALRIALLGRGVTDESKSQETRFCALYWEYLQRKRQLNYQTVSGSEARAHD